MQDREKGTAKTLFDEGGFTHDFTFEDGVIGKEFEEQMEQLRAEEELRKSKELVESQKLIKAIQLEELDSGMPKPVAEAVPEAADSSFIAMQRQVEAEIEQQKRDEELARTLQEQMEKNETGVTTRRAILTPKTKKTATAVSSTTKGPRQLTLEETIMQSRKRKRDQTS